MLYHIKGRYYWIEQRRKKMGIVLNLQLSAFCNCKIEPSAKNISILMEKINSLNIKEFLPNVTTGQTIDLVKGKVESVSNLGFVTVDKSSQIMCQDDRIDCVFNFAPDVQGDFEGNIENLKVILKLILQESKIVSNRLAFNVNLLSDSYVGNLQNTSFGHNIVSTLNFYKDKELKEWSSRENIWHEIKIANVDEMLNVITELSMVTSNPGEEKRLLCHMDINTIHENSGYRFGYQSIDEFVDETKKIIMNIKTNFEELGRDVDD